MLTRSCIRVARWQTLQMQRPGWLPATTGPSAARVPLLAGAYLVLVAAVILRSDPAITSYADVSEALSLANLVAGALLLAAGSLAWALRRRRLGLLAIAAGASWFGADLAGVVGLAPIIRSAGVVASLIVFPLLVHLVAHVHGVDGTGRARRIIALLYLITGTLAVAWLAAYVPWNEPRCVSLCDEVMVGPLADHRLARVLATTGQIVTVVAGMALAVWAAARYVRSTTVARHRTGRTLLPAGLVGIAWAVSAAASTRPSTTLPPLGDVMVTLFLARAVAASLLGLGLAWWLLDGRRTLLAVRRIANDLSPLPGGGSLRAALATALGDPGLELVFPLPDGAGYVDADGAMVSGPSMRPDRHGTPIADGGRIVAVAVGHDDGPTLPLANDLGDAVRLAASNERLLAAVRHQILELRASRARIVEAGDTARHSLERDLHDGAQHRMLGVLHELSLAQGRALEAGDLQAAGNLTAAIADADYAIESLRRLARGIHPATLTEAGLLPALEVLADEAAIPVEIDAPAGVRFAPEVEATAWRVVAQTVAAAHQLDAAGVSARVRLVAQVLEVDVEVEGASLVPDLTSLQDRVGAIGGSLTTRRADDRMTRVHVELPCA